MAKKARESLFTSKRFDKLGEKGRERDVISEEVLGQGEVCRS